MSGVTDQRMVTTEDGVPGVDDILEALSLASVGLDVRLEADAAQADQPLAVIGAALNILLEDLAFRRREREDALQQVAIAEAKQEFLAYLSHDMQTPLSMLLGALELLGGGDEEDVQAVVPLMRHAIGTLQRLVQQFLDLARLDADRPLEVATRPIDLLAVVRSAVSLFADRGRIEVVAPAQLPRIMADAGRVEQILANLLGNAFKYARDPAVEVVLTDEGCAEVTIVDRGDGLTAVDLDEAFGKFSRGGSSRASGTGLGLFISRALAEAMEGSLRAESRPGIGSRFTLSLPVVDRADGA